MKRSMVISLIGRPNVGKSSIFNRLMKRANKAITHDRPGVTRDRHYGIAKFEDLRTDVVKDAILVDTGGFYFEEISGRDDDKNSEKIANKFFNIMTEHAKLAISESDLVLLVVDVREGLIPFDERVASFIRTQGKPFLVLVNKFDHEGLTGEESQFYALGVDEEDLLTVSAEHALGLDHLRKVLHKKISEFEKATSEITALSKGVTPREEVVGRIAIIGAPNAGKSTLLNRLVGGERALVSDIPGTTVDPIEAFFDLFFGKDSKILSEEITSKSNKLLIEEYENFRKNNQDFIDDFNDAETEEESDDSTSESLALDDGEEMPIDQLYDRVFNEEEEEAPVAQTKEEGSFWRTIHIVDTAGIRKKAEVTDFVESQSVFRSLRSITESDIVLLMVDATKGMTHQDRRLADIALEKGKSMIVVLNKLDLIKSKLKTPKERKEWLLDLRAYIPWLNFCDLVPVSAKYGEAMSKLKNSIKKTVLVRHKHIGTGELNRAVTELVSRNQIVPKGSRGQFLKVKYAAYIKSTPPTFLLFTNKSKDIPDNYKRYLKNGLRDHFKLHNSPIHLIFRTGTDLDRRMKQVTTS